MASQVRPGSTQPIPIQGHPKSVRVIGRRSAYSIRARGFAPQSEAGCMAAISSCDPETQRSAWQRGASMYGWWITRLSTNAGAWFMRRMPPRKNLPLSQRVVRLLRCVLRLKQISAMDISRYPDTLLPVADSRLARTARFHCRPAKNCAGWNIKRACSNRNAISVRTATTHPSVRISGVVPALAAHAPAVAGSARSKSASAPTLS